jgi:hypothetical protein
MKLWVSIGQAKQVSNLLDEHFEINLPYGYELGLSPISSKLKSATLQNFRQKHA